MLTGCGGCCGSKCGRAQSSTIEGLPVHCSIAMYISRARRSLYHMLGTDLAFKVHCSRTGEKGLVVGFLCRVGSHRGWHELHALNLR